MCRVTSYTVSWRDTMDQLAETLARDEFEERTAIGEIDGEDVMVVAETMTTNDKEFCVLTTHAGGENVTKGDYLFHKNGSTMQMEEGSAKDLRDTFDTLVEKHDLDVLDET